jgi:hypothetical protein
VSGQPLIESELPEEAQGGSEPLLAMPALILDGVERREGGRNAI